MNDGIKGGMRHPDLSVHHEIRSRTMRITLPLVLAGLIALIAILSRVIITFGTNETFSSFTAEYTHRFSAGFMCIFLEAVPFILMGALAAAVVEHVFSTEEISSIYSKKFVPGFAAALLTGLVLPVGEGGSIILGRALIRKGAAISSAVVVMLAGAVLNIVPLALLTGSEETSWIYALRAVIGAGFAILVGLLVSSEKESERVLHPDLMDHPSDSDKMETNPLKKSTGSRMKSIGVTTARESLEFLPYIVAAALLAATLQIFIPADWIPPIQGGIKAQIGYAGLWALLSAQGTIGDVLMIQNSAYPWSISSQTTYLVLGALLDIKLIFLYVHVLRRKVVVYLAVLAIAVSILAGLLVGILG